MLVMLYQSELGALTWGNKCIFVPFQHHEGKEGTMFSTPEGVDGVEPSLQDQQVLLSIATFD